MEKIKKLIAAIKSKDFFRSLQSPTTTKIDLNCLDCKVDLMDDSGYLAFGICSACGHKDTLSAKQWVNLLFDKASFDEKLQCWEIETDKGEKITTQYFIMATGCISTAQIPKIPGLEGFKGEVYHTGNWPHKEIDFSSSDSIAVNNIFSSLTKKGRYLITVSVDGRIASYTGTFSLGNAIISSFHDS